MKKEYIKPLIDVCEAEADSVLAGSGPSVYPDGSTTEQDAKQSNLFYFPYDNDDKNL